MRVLLEVASDQDDLAGGVLHVTDILKKANDVSSATWLNFARLYLDVARGQRNPPEQRSHPAHAPAVVAGGRRRSAARC